MDEVWHEKLANNEKKTLSKRTLVIYSEKNVQSLSTKKTVFKILLWFMTCEFAMRSADWSLQSLSWPLSNDLAVLKTSLQTIWNIIIQSHRYCFLMKCENVWLVLWSILSSFVSIFYIQSISNNVLTKHIFINNIPYSFLSFSNLASFKNFDLPIVLTCQGSYVWFTLVRFYLSLIIHLLP